MIEKLSELALSDEKLRVGVEFARFLWRIDHDIPDQVLLAGCLTACAVEDSHTCLHLDPGHLQEYMESRGIKDLVGMDASALQDIGPEISKVIGSPGEFSPLVLCNDRLYIQRYWAAEDLVARRIKEMAQKRLSIPDSSFNLAERLFPRGDISPDWQKIAALNACSSGFSVISGGPGTGKTRTVAALMVLLIDAWASETHPLMALCAPTGKAVARLNESISSSLRQLPIPDEFLEHLPDRARTVHRLLGRGRDAATYHYHGENRLPHDVVIVDEASMLDLTMMLRLTDALKKDARLILIGDKDQLASVEAGSVLSDICHAVKGTYSQDFVQMARNAGQDIGAFTPKARPSLADCMVELRHNFRFGKESGIHELARTVNIGDPDNALNVLEDPSVTEVQFVEPGSTNLEEFLVKEMKEIASFIKACKTPDEAMNLLERVKILCAVKEGPTGTKAVNEFICRCFFHSSASRPFQGLPIIIRRNDYILGLFNGDAGIVWNDEQGNLRAYFNIDGKIEGFSLSRLPIFEPAWAITVHVSQGSEFDRVLFLLPRLGSAVAGRELIYTAITRAKSSMAIYGDRAALAYCIKHPTMRMSGLRQMLEEE